MDLFQNKIGSISWECLPFTSKKGKQNGKKSKNDQANRGNVNNYQTSKTETSLDKITDKSFSSEDDAYESTTLMSSSKLRGKNSKNKSDKTVQPVKQHQPYAANLVNDGFGFGFDLEGGDGDNQLTFIVNVQPNGDAARKGLTDGKFIVNSFYSAQIFCS
jgi:hypothetical protein